MEKGLRGGISMVSIRINKTDSPQFPQYYSSKPSNWVVNIDANNLYSWAMRLLLPVGGFQWSSLELKIDEVLTTPDDVEYGYIVGADIENTGGDGCT